MLNHDQGPWKILGQMREKILQRVGSAGGNADGDHLGRLLRRLALAGVAIMGSGKGGDHLGYPGGSGHSYLLDQLFLNGVDIPRKGAVGLGDEIQGTERERLQGAGRTFGGV